MPTSHLDNIAQRYAIVSKEKADGITYTPRLLSDFVADQIAANIREFPTDRPLRLLDPAVGDGELLISLLRRIGDPLGTSIEVYGFETDVRAVGIASERIKAEFSQVDLYLEQADFLQFVLDHFGANKHQSFFDQKPAKHYDLIIANPPYVRTQVMGADGSKVLAQQFGLCGRVDLYHAFILAMARVLAPNGIAGIIVSNRFMTTMSGSSVRRAILERFNLRHVWDLGDTKPFGAAVLPAVLLLEGKNGHSPRIPGFTTIYETQDPPNAKTDNPIQALSLAGCIEVEDGRRFLVQHGNLTYNDPDDIWRISTKEIDNWLSLVDAHTWKTFGDIGKIRVGVKTCADKVFIRSDWGDMPESERPELIRPLITHHVARRFKAKSIKSPKQILYPHESVQGCRRVVNLADYPRSKNYLERHRSTLMSRKYVIEAGREWYEIWVPQDPQAWEQTKLVFRDITDKPTFWIDQDHSVVNGDCYWMVCNEPEQTDLLWLAAAIGNSRFIEQFYDARFNNKLYAGRRRFITQYVEKFPLPNPAEQISKIIIAKAKEIYENISSQQAQQLQEELECLVFKAFGLDVKEV